MILGRGAGRGDVSAEMKGARKTSGIPTRAATPPKPRNTTTPESHRTTTTPPPLSPRNLSKPLPHPEGGVGRGIPMASGCICPLRTPQPRPHISGPPSSLLSACDMFLELGHYPRGGEPPLTLRQEKQYLYFGHLFPCTPGPFSL